jgi:hypothetical protein
VYIINDGKVTGYKPIITQGQTRLTQSCPL